jgi:hypothetical protein
MAQNYLTGRTSRFAVGVPGFTTSKDLVLRVDGALGIDTTIPRTDLDTPNISIRGDLFDQTNSPGGNAYFLSKDINGVKWVEVKPFDTNSIFVLDNGAIVGAGSFIGIDFVSFKDTDFVKVSPSPSNPQLAQVAYDVRWVRTNYGGNKSISTSFGNDGTYASLPGFGTTEATGITSVGIGTNQAQDDFQVGVGSTGVTINGPEGFLKAQKIQAKEIAVEGNLEVESLIVRPGVATLTDLEVLNTATIPTEYVGFSSIKQANIDFLFASEVLAGLTTLGFGGKDVFVLNDLYVQGGLGTFQGDVFIGGDLTVKGETFFNQINAENILVTGIGTFNEIEANGIGVTSLIVSGFTTLSNYSFNIGVGTYLELQDLNASGVGSFGEIFSQEITAGLGSFSKVESGVIDAGFGTFKEIVAIGGTIGSIESDGDATTLKDLLVTGVSTFIGIGTFADDLYVGNDLFVNGDVTFKNINGEQLLISGVGTIFQLESQIGIITSLFAESLQVTGIATLRGIDNQELQTGVVTSFSINNTGIITTAELDAEFANIRILTGDNISYQIGTISNFTAGVGSIGILTGLNLSYFEESFIDGTTFDDGDVNISRNIRVAGVSTFVGLGTFGGDLYVQDDLYVGGTLNFNQLTGENLLITGVATITDLKVDVGVVTSLETENLVVTGIATIQDTLGVAGTYTKFTTNDLNVTNLANIDTLLAREATVSEVLDARTILAQEEVVGILTVTNSVDINGDIDIIGDIDMVGDIDLIGDTTMDGDLNVSGVTTTNELAVVGFATIGQIETEQIQAGVITTTDLLVTGITTFEGEVNIEEVEFVELSVTGVSSINQLFVNTGLATFFQFDDTITGIATIGLASITRLEVTDIFADDVEVGSNLNVSGITTVFDLNVDNSLEVTGPSTFVGFTTMSGDLFIDGNLTVTGFVSFTQLNADQSQIGILTVFESLDASTAIGTFKHLETVDSALFLGVSTIGLTTFKDGDVNIARNLTVTGITTFEGVVNIDETSFINQEVTGISSVNQLFVNTGVATNFTVDNFFANIGIVTDLTVTGASTFVGFATFQGDVHITEDLEVTRNQQIGLGLTVGEYIKVPNFVSSGIATFNKVEVGSIDIGIGTIGEVEIGSATVGFLTVTGDAEFQSDVEIAKDLKVNQNLQVVGFTTLTDDVSLESDLDVFNRVTTFNLTVSNVANIQSGIITTLVTEDATIGISTTKVGAIGTLTTYDFNVIGFSTFKGNTFFSGNVTIDGDLTVTGIATYAQLDADQSQIGILTVSNYLNVNNIIQDAVGFSTLSDFTANSGVITSIQSEVIANSGDLTVGGGATISLDIDVDGDADIAGDLALGGDLTVGAGATITNDLVVGKDQSIGQNLSVVGFITALEIDTSKIDAEQLFSVTGVVTNISGTNLNYEDAYIGDLRALDIETGTFISTEARIGDLNVTGLSTFIGIATFSNDVFIDGNVSIGGTLKVENIELPSSGNEGNISGDTLDFNSGTIDNLISEYILTTDLGVTGVATVNTAIIGNQVTSGVASITSIKSTQIENSGLTTTGVLFVESVARIEDLIVNDTFTVGGISIFQGEVTIDDNLLVTGDTTIIDIIGRNATFNGITTNITQFTNYLNISGGFDATGVSTFNTGLNVKGAPLVVDTTIFANAGFITTLNGTSLIYQDGQFTDELITKDLNVQQNATVAGILTATNTNVTGILTATIADVTQLTADVATVKSVLTFNSGFGTSLVIEDITADFIQTQDLTVTGIATIPNLGVTHLEAATINVGIITAQEYDLNDTTTIQSYKFTSTSTTTFNAVTWDPAEYRTLDIVIQASEGSNFHSSKLHAIHDGAATPNVFFNEYSNIYNNAEVGTFDIVGLSSAVTLRIGSASTSTTNYVINVTATRV